MQQPIRARVPDHVSGGAFSTGVIVMTAHSEFILDFVQNLGRPHQIVSRVVMPHYVLPQLVDALHRNIELYRSRWGGVAASQHAGSRTTTMDQPRSHNGTRPASSPGIAPGHAAHDTPAGVSLNPKTQPLAIHPSRRRERPALIPIRPMILCGRRHPVSGGSGTWRFH